MLLNFEKNLQEAWNLNNIVFQENPVLVSDLQEASHAEVMQAAAIKCNGSLVS